MCCEGQWIKQIFQSFKYKISTLFGKVLGGGKDGTVC